MTAISTESSERSPLEIRNLHFATKDGDVPRHWLGGRKSVTSFFDTLSLFFPAGERFFIQSVSAHKGRVTHERLRDDVRRFCGQEGVHTREHVRYNEMLQAQGYPVERLETRVARRLGFVKRHAPKRTQLAVTCALEHFTAILATFVLRDPRLLEDAHPEMRALWQWHSAEEYEHRAVAFDVYQAAGGTYAERVRIMLHVTLFFWTMVLLAQFEMMRADGTQWSFAEWRALGRWLFVEPGPMRTVGARWREYFRRDFHPSKHGDGDDQRFFEAWRDSYQAPAAP